MRPKITEQQEEEILQNLRSKWQEYAEKGFSLHSFLKYEAKQHYKFVVCHTNIVEELKPLYDEYLDATRETLPTVGLFSLARKGIKKLRAGEEITNIEFAAFSELQKRNIAREKNKLDREFKQADNDRKQELHSKIMAENEEEGLLAFGLREMTEDEYLQIMGPAEEESQE